MNSLITANLILHTCVIFIEPQICSTLSISGLWRSGCSYGDDSSEGRHDRSVVHALLQAIHRGVRLGRFDRSTRYLSQFVQVNCIRIRNVFSRNCSKY